MNEEDVGNCLIVSSVADAKNKSTDIGQADRDLLLEVYDKLEDGSMKLPIEEDHVIRELVDVSFTTACRESDDGHKQKLAEDGVTISLKFHLGVDASTEVLVLTYIDGQWDFIESVTNNGDGTLTCVFEDICPVAFVVRGQTGGSQTGDPAGQRLILWVCLMVASAGALTVMFVKRRKNAR
jgi:hypothetical protein